ncbi:SMC-Scp complex subunit ScpB [Candidatus Uhrbacteria bacterium CG_4_10_14_0_8_um_filter_58_22]|uniref:SMC-Scp complex subunit ScpB n=1 Tax=Candidatus Uhrbacteria bacterium CG_4_10_14_0_8_um_filter_58_22 TaxID=1975029 RepID=A0A2M7Q9H9_9BACT|nr:MAG: SMC-Scp complex subunit ScpB [Parcubacteria group bacterium CG1_02_58_44]PIY62375.1 MAG: SMC-Scp complex subunit ScpB [Candidatus Uhrbacteria bacterium CG_4_10_14_0_8_um_filter_58_22]
MTINMLRAKVESILFVVNRPLTVAKLAEVCGAKKAEVAEAVSELAEAYSDGKSGLRLLRHGDSVQMSTSQDTSELVGTFLKDETTGEMTRPSLETLTIVAYRGPLTKPELEQVRGVNCSLILRNLMMRGLVESLGDSSHPLTQFRVTMDFLRFLGVASVEELPDYDLLRSDENVTRAMENAVGPSIGSDVNDSKEEGKE